MSYKGRVFIVSLGCDKNRIDAEIMAARIAEAGYELCGDLNKADCAVVNTCGFIDSAKEESIGFIFDMVRAKEDPEQNLSKIVVTGCLAQRYAAQLTELVPEIDAVTDLSLNGDITNTLDRVFSCERFTGTGRAEQMPISGKRVLSSPKHYAYIKISEGCLNHCTYCAIPSIRGRYRSRPPEEILLEARELASAGAKELILVAQDTTAYGVDLTPKSSLGKLLEILCTVDGVWKIRVLYAYPERITDELLEVFARNDKIAKYLDIPLQHSDAEVLRGMGRFGNRDTMAALIEKIRTAVAGITLRSTFIVGFPGETREQFESLLNFLSVARFERAGCFAFSREEGTPADKLDGQLDDDEKKDRAEKFMLQQSIIMTAAQSKKVGEVFEAICDGYDRDKLAFACRTESDLPEDDTVVWLYSPNPVEAGDVVKVRIIAVDDNGEDLIAEPAE